MLRYLAGGQRSNGLAQRKDYIQGSLAYDLAVILKIYESLRVHVHVFL